MNNADKHIYVNKNVLETSPLEGEEKEIPFIKVQNLSIAFCKKEKKIDTKKIIVNNISFEIKRGETLALVGESGSGKSITALSILRLLESPPAIYPSGEIWLQDGARKTGLLKLRQDEIRKIRGNKISMIFQEPMTSLNPLHNIEQQIGEILNVHKGINGQKARIKVVELLEKVGIPDPVSRLKSYPHQLSGGQRQRVMIAIALANDPELLIADEPTTALDVTIQAKIIALLKKIQQETQMSMLFITHDLGIVRKIAQRVAVMKNGEIVEIGGTEKILNNPQHEYTKILLSAEPGGSPTLPQEQMKITLEAQDVSVHFPIKSGFLQRITGFIRAVDNVSFIIRAGETLGIVGESGSGKTTLAHALLRLIPSMGKIIFLAQEIQAFNQKQIRPLRRKMQMVFQDPFGSLSPRMSIVEIISEGILIQNPHISSKNIREMVANIMEEVGLEPYLMDRYPHEFSGGQRQRIAIARAIILEPELLILDEPTSALDRSVQAQVVDLLRELQKKRNISYIFISHDLKVVKALASHVLVMKNGVMVEYGVASDIFASPKQEYTKELFAAAFS